MADLQYGSTYGFQASLFVHYIYHQFYSLVSLSGRPHCGPSSHLVIGPRPVGDSLRGRKLN